MGKPHVVLIPLPAQGHITPMMNLGKIMHSKGFHITFVHTEFNYRRFIRSNGPESMNGLPGFQFETIPDGLPPSDEDATQDITMLCVSMRGTCFEPFKKLLLKLNSMPDAPKVSCVISDGSFTFGVRAAKEMGILDVVMWTGSTCCFVGFLNFRELLEREIFPLKDLTNETLNTPLDWIIGMPNICLKDLPSFMRSTDPHDVMFHYAKEVAQDCLKASAIIFNTFMDFEKNVLEALVSKFNFPNIYPIGPLHLLSKNVNIEVANSLDPSLWKPDSKAIEWLDARKSRSVVYVNYGSITTMTSHHFREFAWGLAKSKVPFLWIVRRDVVKGDSTMLPEEFFEETKDRGLLVNWCAQEKVMAHKAVGAFLTHCGWNSTLESVCCGVPMICWPFFADQQTNCHYLCEKWGIGVEINHDVKRDEVAELVREIMGGEKGKKTRMNAQKWKAIAEEAINIGGSSYVHFDKLVNETICLGD